MTDSPSITNYQIGKGVVSFKKNGESTFRDLGNVPSFEFTPEIEKLEHFSSREGVKSKDRVVVLSKSGTLKLELEEITAENLALAVLGDQGVDSDGNVTIDIFSTNAVSGAVKFTGTNEVGNKFEWLFNKVDFIPSDAIALISDEWGSLTIQGECATVGGSFGTITKIGNEAGASDSESA
jgi:hypothetical protein